MKFPGDNFLILFAAVIILVAVIAKILSWG